MQVWADLVAPCHGESKTVVCDRVVLLRACAELLIDKRIALDLASCGFGHACAACGFVLLLQAI